MIRWTDLPVIVVLPQSRALAEAAEARLKAVYAVEDEDYRIAARRIREGASLAEARAEVARRQASRSPSPTSHSRRSMSPRTWAPPSPAQPSCGRVASATQTSMQASPLQGSTANPPASDEAGARPAAMGSTEAGGGGAPTVAKATTVAAPDRPSRGNGVDAAASGTNGGTDVPEQVEATAQRRSKARHTSQPPPPPPPTASQPVSTSRDAPVAPTTTSTPSAPPAAPADRAVGSVPSAFRGDVARARGGVAAEDSESRPPPPPPPPPHGYDDGDSQAQRSRQGRTDGHTTADTSSNDHFPLFDAAHQALLGQRDAAASSEAKDTPDSSMDSHVAPPPEQSATTKPTVAADAGRGRIPALLPGHARAHQPAVGSHTVFYTTPTGELQYLHVASRAVPTASGSAAGTNTRPHPQEAGTGAALRDAGRSATRPRPSGDNAATSRAQDEPQGPSDNHAPDDAANDWLGAQHVLQHAVFPSGQDLNDSLTVAIDAGSDGDDSFVREFPVPADSAADNHPMDGDHGSDQRESRSSPTAAPPATSSEPGAVGSDVVGTPPAMPTSSAAALMSHIAASLSTPAAFTPSPTASTGVSSNWNAEDGGKRAADTTPAYMAGAPVRRGLALSPPSATVADEPQAVRGADNEADGGGLHRSVLLSTEEDDFDVHELLGESRT